MEGKGLSKLFNHNLIDVQIRFTFFIVLISVFVGLFRFVPYKGADPDMLRIDVNKAGFDQLISVPYIGIKNAEKIIKIRKEKGGITDLKQLKNLRYYKRFKYFLKVE